MKRRDADVWLDTRAEIGEGPIWDHREERLLFVDIPAGELYSTGMAGCAVVRGIGQPLGAVGLRGHSGYVLGTERGFAFMEHDGAIEALPEPALSSDLVMNDSQVGPDGSFWGGSRAWDSRPGAGSVYRLGPDGTVETVVEGVTISNGLGWSIDGKCMYYVDSPTQSIDVFDFDVESGAIANRRSLAKVPDGLPDGLCVDEEGSIWVAIYGAGLVNRYSPKGDLIGAVRIPAQMATSCCFGGPDLEVLFITSGSAHLSLEERHAQHAGALFATDVGVRGRRANVFRDDSRPAQG
jgi:sugar lactone lactonase YvrE